MPDQFVALHFSSADAAESAMGTIQMLAAEGFVVIDDAAIIQRGDGGAVTARSVGGDTGRAIGLAGGLGLAAGALVGLPVIGAAAGAAWVARRSMGDSRLDELLTSLGRELDRNTTVLALTVSELRDPGTVTDRLDVHRDALVRADVPADIEALLEGTPPDHGNDQRG